MTSQTIRTRIAAILQVLAGGAGGVALAGLGGALAVGWGIAAGLGAGDWWPAVAAGLAVPLAALNGALLVANGGAALLRDAPQRMWVGLVGGAGLAGASLLVALSLLPVLFWLGVLVYVMWNIQGLSYGVSPC